ncbi:DUF4349 domain-containing protein [Phytomonospora endophytica]|uniref:DUF4349 domain-containing protein n=1 Tax=Phytomonospora endophytica TaxID=714109 RepID=A0A841FLB6_9ACTN|nr:DUF4349 domain-containing protein [Phytomonospora endophytica]MBB6036654.1 hypothetical protein [Phytomonospora endophytica]GIG65976.1 lipoprotein [Phytomonospora endophytica]
MRRLAALLLPIALAVPVLTGCSAGREDSDSGTATGGDPAPAATEAPAAREGADRLVVYTGELSLTAPDVPGAARQAIAAVDAVDGFVAGDEREGSGDTATATLTLRIPAEVYTATVESLAALGTEQARELSTTDVTETSADLDTRIATKRASVERVRELMENAASLSEVVALEAELTTREAELAELQAKQRDLTDAVTFGTLTLRLESPVNETAPAGPPGFGSGVASGWDGLLLFLGVSATVLGFLLPFLVVVGLPLAALWTWSRRRRGLPVLRRAPRRPAPPFAGEPGGPKPPGPGRF